MSETFLSKTGLSYFWGRIKTIFATKTDMTTALIQKVDKVEGMLLSTNDYTTAEKIKLDGVATGAQINVLEGVAVNGIPAEISNKLANIMIPTNNSDLTNDAGYQNATQVISLIDEAIGGVSGMEFIIVESLPATGVKGTIYLLANSGGGDTDIYDEFIYLDGGWEHIGSTAVDLSDYWSKADLGVITTAEIDAIAV